MSITVETMRESYGAIQAKMNEFKEKGAIHLTDDELDEIDHVIQTQANNLKNYAAMAAAREKQLSAPSFIKNVPKNILKFTGINGVCKALWLTGSILQYVETSYPTKAVSLAVTVVGAVADIISAGYGAKIGVDFNDTMQIMQLDERTQTAAENCRVFIERFREIKKLNVSNPVISNPNPDVQTINVEHTSPETLNPLDTLAKACMKVYEKLPEKYRTENGRDQVISVIIQTYPKYDPLQSKLRSLSSSTSDINSAAIASGSHSVRPAFLHSSSDSNPSDESDRAVKSDSEEIQDAFAEGRNPLPVSYVNLDQNTSTHSAPSDTFGPYEERRPSPTPATLEDVRLMEQENYNRKIQNYSNLVMQRLGLKRPPKNIIAFN